jgi:hypothetical protein
MRAGRCAVASIRRSSSACVRVRPRPTHTAMRSRRVARSHQSGDPPSACVRVRPRPTHTAMRSRRAPVGGLAPDTPARGAAPWNPDLMHSHAGTPPCMPTRHGVAAGRGGRWDGRDPSIAVVPCRQRTEGRIASARLALPPAMRRSGGRPIRVRPRSSASHVPACARGAWRTNPAILIRVRPRASASHSHGHALAARAGRTIRRSPIRVRPRPTYLPARVARSHQSGDLPSAFVRVRPRPTHTAMRSRRAPVGGLAPDAPARGAAPWNPDLMHSDAGTPPCMPTRHGRAGCGAAGWARSLDCRGFMQATNGGADRIRPVGVATGHAPIGRSGGPLSVPVRVRPRPNNHARRSYHHPRPRSSASHSRACLVAEACGEQFDRTETR